MLTCNELLALRTRIQDGDASAVTEGRGALCEVVHQSDDVETMLFQLAFVVFANSPREELADV